MRCLLAGALWLSPAMEARDLLSFPYNPRVWTVPPSRAIQQHISKADMRKRMKEAANYDTMHPTLKEWVDRNEQHYRFIAAEGGRSELYENRESGVVLFERGGKLYMERTHFFADDVPFDFKKEEAINPATKRPWIELSDKEKKIIERKSKGGRLNEEEAQFVQDVLDILNENFHYYYGMQLIDLGRDPHVDKAQLMGKIIPAKFFLFGYDIDLLDVSSYSEQQIALYRTLGHPVYSYKFIISEPGSTHRENRKQAFAQRELGVPSLSYASLCDSRYSGLTSGISQTYSIITLFYHAQVNPEEIFPSRYTRNAQVGTARPFLMFMLEQAERLFAERGMDATDKSANTEALPLALYFIYQKTKLYVEELVTHDYVRLEGDAFGEGINRLSDVVDITGIKTKPSDPAHTPRKKQRKKADKLKAREELYQAANQPREASPRAKKQGSRRKR